MKFSIKAKAFAGALASAAKAVERRNTIPILSNVLLRAEGGRLHLQATNLDVEVSLAVDADVTQDGSITIPVNLAAAMLAKIPSDADVSFEHGKDGRDATIKAGRSRISILVLPAGDYPQLNAGNMDCSFELTGEQLTTALQKVSFAISTEETRYYLNGVYIHIVDGHGDAKYLTFVATDGHRLARTRIDGKGMSDFPSIIVPRTTIALIRDLCKGAETVRIEASQTKIRISVGDMVIVSKLIDGTFPDYQRVIPLPTNRIVRVNAKALAVSSDRVSTMASERGRAVRVGVEPGKLNLSVNNPDSGSAEEEIDTEFDGEPVEIGFNMKYLGDALAQIGGGTANIAITDSGSPAVFTTDDDSNTTIVLMPMRI